MGALDYISVFVLGLTGTGHCIGMCGAFAVAAGAGPGGGIMLLLRQVSYQLGKSTAYVFLGVLLTLAASAMSDADRLGRFGEVLGWIVGGVMILGGAAQLSGFRIGPRAERLLGGGGFCATVFAAARAPTLARSLLVGWVNGFLPCGLSFAALLFMAQFGSVLDTTVGAYVFGLGTLPGLWLVAGIGQRFSTRHRVAWVRFAGVALIALGLLTIFRGVPEVHEWVHGALVPGGHSGAGHAHH
ncbi:MAG TPA: sulfite exporter TauE/SafE family protein [Opitutaceae bacterium]